MRELAFIGSLVVCLCCPGDFPLRAAPPDPPSEAPPDSRDEDADDPGLQFQELEDPVRRLRPVRPRVVSDERRLDSLAWFGVGRLRQAREDGAGALEAYGKAIDSDPTAIAVYRAAVPLAVELKDVERAAKWAVRAVELDPTDQQFLLFTADLLIKRDDMPGAIHLFEVATRAPGVDRLTPQYVLFMRHLAVLYAAADRLEDAAAGFEIVFDALTNPDRYQLPVPMRSQLQSDPTTSYERMGQVFLDAKKTDLALAAFKKASESRKGPAAGNLSYNLAQVYLQAGDAAQALEQIEQYIDGQRQSKGRAAYELLAEVLEKLGRPTELITRLEEAAAKDSRNSTLQYYLAERYAIANRLEKAELLFKQTLDSAAEPQGYVGLAGVYRRMGRASDVIDALSKGFVEAQDVKQMASEFKAIIQDDKLFGEVLEAGLKRLAEQPPQLDFAAGYVLANLAADGKRSVVAEKLYRYLLPLRPERAASLFEELGGHLVEVRKYAEAVRVFQEAVDDPGLAENRWYWLFHLTQALELAGETKQALDAIAQAQQMVPEEALLQTALLRSQEAWVYYHSHQYDQAIPRFEKLIADFTHPQARQIVRRAQYSLSNIYVLSGDVPRGMEILEAIFRENPNDISVNNDLGYLYADQDMHLEQAEGMIRKALAAEPKNAAYLDSMGWVLFKRGKAEEAVPFLEEAIKISTGGGDETLHDHLGDVYDRLGESAKAVESWKKSLDLARPVPYPDQKLIERVEEKLKNRTQDAGKLRPAKPGAP